jgi:hypothetical protein
MFMPQIVAAAFQLARKFSCTSMRAHLPISVEAWNFSGACPSPLRFDAVAPKLKAKAENLEFGALSVVISSEPW